jgi:hypothetical protein
MSAKVRVAMAWKAEGPVGELMGPVLMSKFWRPGSFLARGMWMSA